MNPPARRGRRPTPQKGPRPAVDFDHDPAAPASVPSSSKPATSSREQAQDSGEGRTRRLNVPVSSEHLRVLNQARVDDGISGARRVRAMIAVWQSSAEIRRKVDEYAQRHEE